MNIEQQAMPLLAKLIDPVMQQDLLSLGAVDQLRMDGPQLHCRLTVGYPAVEPRQELVALLVEALVQLDGVEKVSIDDGWQAPANVAVEGENKQALTQVKNIVAVASGKGGVGKSTTTVNLALAMSALGARVGILDADIYGPSQPKMLGVEHERPSVRDQKALRPVMAYELQSMSMGYMLTDSTPAVWRGPMATGALQQLIFQTDWEQLDYLFVDMPPGTGDIQLTLSQQVPVSGAVVVTTPQDIALLDAKKGIEMFQKVSIPVLGVIENMAVHHCSNCGHEEHIFGEGGGKRIAEDYQSELIAALPLALSIREQADSGKPSVVAEPEGAISKTYKEAALKLAGSLWLQNRQVGMPEIVVSED